MKAMKKAMKKVMKKAMKTNKAMIAAMKKADIPGWEESDTEKADTDLLFHPYNTFARELWNSRVKIRELVHGRSTSTRHGREYQCKVMKVMKKKVMKKKVMKVMGG